MPPGRGPEDVPRGGQSTRPAANCRDPRRGQPTAQAGRRSGSQRPGHAARAREAAISAPRSRASIPRSRARIRGRSIAPADSASRAPAETGHLQPPGGQHAQDVTVGERGSRRPRRCGTARARGPRARHLLGLSPPGHPSRQRFQSGRSRADLRRRQPLVLAVVPFAQGHRSLTACSPNPASSQVSRARRSGLHSTSENGATGQRGGQRLSAAPTLLGQR